METKTFGSGRSRKPDPGDALAKGTRSGRGKKALTIGAVCKLLKDEFPDVSISKIRYLEDQGLLAPRRTQGGYRLYSQVDVGRLRTILRLQRDEFLPLRVIRQELAAGRSAEPDDEGEAPVRQVALAAPPRPSIDREQLAEQTGVDERSLKELEEFGLISANGRGGEGYSDVDREIVNAAAELHRYGVAPRNLRVFRTSAEREAGLLEQIFGASLRSANPEKRKQAVESLESMAATVSRLQHLLLLRDLRRLVGEP